MSEENNTSNNSQQTSNNNNSSSNQKKKKYNSMNYLYANLEKEKSISSMNYITGDLSLNVDVYLIPKAQNWDSSDITYLKLPQGSKLKKLILNDSIYNLAFQGTASFVCESNDVSTLIEDAHALHLVIMFTAQPTEKSEAIKFEPLIFDITEAISLEKSGTTENIEVKFEDILISTSKRSTVAELQKEYPSIMSSATYTSLYKEVIKFLISQISMEFNNTLFYDSVVYSDEFQTEENSFEEIANNPHTPLIKLTFDKLRPNATVYELLEMLKSDACANINYNQTFLEMREVGAGSLAKSFTSVPMFLKTEWRDPMGMLTTMLDREYFFNEGMLSSDLSTDSTRNLSQVEQNNILPRYITLKNIFTPFKIAFHNQNTTSELGFIYENINTNNINETEPKFLSINGNTTINNSFITVTDVVSYDKLPIDAVKSNSIWRNMIFVKENGGATSMSTLVYFSWCRDFFNKIFLNDAGDSRNHFVTNVYPTFLAHEKEKDQSGEDTAFNRFNATTKLLRSTDTNAEIFRFLGKTVASMILLNNSYSITLGGNIFRHPNEIIRISSNNSSEESRIKIITDLNSNCALCYVLSVSHFFDCENKRYFNNIICNKIGNYVSRSNN